MNGETSGEPGPLSDKLCFPSTCRNTGASLGHCLKLEDSAIYLTTINSAYVGTFPQQPLTCGTSCAQSLAFTWEQGPSVGTSYNAHHQDSCFSSVSNDPYSNCHLPDQRFTWSCNRFAKAVRTDAERQSMVSNRDPVSGCCGAAHPWTMAIVPWTWYPTAVSHFTSPLW